MCWYTLIAKWDGKLRPGGPDGLRGIRIILLCPTFKQAVDTYSAALAAELEGKWAFLGGKINRSRWRVEFPGGSWIQFFGAENADAARGLRCDVVSPDECDDIPQGVYDAIVTPWFSEPWSFRIRIPSGTPRRGRRGLLSKLYDLGVDGTPGYSSVHATYLDCPRTVSKEYVESVKATTSPATFKREWLADRDAAEGLVYSPFYESHHVRQPPPGQLWTEVIVGVDHGWEDPGCFLVLGVKGNGLDATCWVIEEVYQQHRDETWWVSAAQQIQATYAKYKPKWYADPSMPARIEALRKYAHLSITKAENAIDDGVSSVADRFVVRDGGMSGGPWCGLYVSPTCKNTISELGLYRRKRDPRDAERYLEAIEDKNNHAMDALRYAIFSRFGRPQAVRVQIGAGW